MGFRYDTLYMNPDATGRLLLSVAVSYILAVAVNSSIAQVTNCMTHQCDLGYQSLMAELAEAKQAAAPCAWLCTHSKFVVGCSVNCQITYMLSSVPASVSGAICLSDILVLTASYCCIRAGHLHLLLLPVLFRPASICYSRGFSGSTCAICHHI